MPNPLPAIQLVIRAARSLPVERIAVATTNFARRGWQLGSFANWGRSVLQLAKDNPITTALLAVDLASAGADINLDDVLDSLGDTVPDSIKQYVKAAKQASEVRNTVLGDGDPSTVMGVPVDQFEQSLEMYEAQVAVLKAGIAAAGSPGRYRALKRAFLEVEPRVEARYFGG